MIALQKSSRLMELEFAKWQILRMAVGLLMEAKRDWCDVAIVIATPTGLFKIFELSKSFNSISVRESGLKVTASMALELEE